MLNFVQIYKKLHRAFYNNETRVFNFNHLTGIRQYAVPLSKTKKYAAKK